MMRRAQGETSRRPLRRRGRGRAVRVSVVGASVPAPRDARLARRVGRGLAAAGAVVVCGGLRGVMEAACRGAHEAGGTTVGILPGVDAAEANRHVDLPVVTGIGEGRNLAVALTGHAVVAIGQSLGALSEVALARRHGVAVVGLGTWVGSRELGIHLATDPEDAVRQALALARASERANRGGHGGSRA